MKGVQRWPGAPQFLKRITISPDLAPLLRGDWLDKSVLAT